MKETSSVIIKRRPKNQDITRNAVPSPLKQYLSSVNYTVLAYKDSGKLRAVGSDDLHSFIAKTSTFTVKTNRYIPGVDEYFIPKWKQIIAATLIRAQAAFRSIVAAASVGGAAVGADAEIV